MSGELDDDGYVYLSLAEALEIYAAIFSLTTEQAADHLRSQEALEGALGRPASYAHYQQADLALQAAVLAHGIAETQPFVDGNKRTGLIAMLTFLEDGLVTVAEADQLLLGLEPAVAGDLVCVERGTGHLPRTHQAATTQAAHGIFALTTGPELTIALPHERRMRCAIPRKDACAVNYPSAESSVRSARPTSTSRRDRVRGKPAHWLGTVPQ